MINTNIKSVPDIRFGEFSEAWEQRKLGEIAKKVSNKNKDRLYTETFTNSAEMGIVSQLDFFDHEISNATNIDGYYIVEPNDFVYNPRISTTAPVGPINRNSLERKGVMSPLYTVFRIQNGTNPLFLEWYFKNDIWHHYMFFNGDSGARSDRFSIKDSIFFEMPINLPSIKEQCEIGKFFASLDNLLTLHQRKCEELKATKAALLQKMFPQDGEKVPQIRFAGFTEAWEQRKLKDLGEITTGSTPSTQHPEYYSEDGIPWVTPTDIDTNIIINTARKLSKEGETVARIVPENTILVTCIASIGKNALLLTRGSFNQQINCLTPFQNNDPYFLLTESENWSAAMKKQASSGTMQIVNKKEFSELTTKVPCREEQRQIGLLFRHLDTLLTLHQRKCEELKTLKASLLQKMFV